MLLRKSLPENPILWREMLYQKRSLPRWIVVLDTVGIVAVVLVTIIYIFLKYIYIIGNFSLPRFLWPSPAGEIQIFIWIIYCMTIVRTVIAGVDVMHRNHVYNTSNELLTITSVNTFSVISATTQSGLFRIKAWYLALGLAQVGVIPVVAINLLITTIAYQCTLDGCTSQVSYLLTLDRQEFTAFVVLLISILFLNLLDLTGCLFLGMMATFISRRGIFAVFIGIFLRFIPIIIFAFVPDNPPYNYVYPAGLLHRSDEFTWFGFTGSSIIGAMRLLSIIVSGYAGRFARAVLALNAAIITQMFIIMVAGSVLYYLIKHKTD